MATNTLAQMIPRPQIWTLALREKGDEPGSSAIPDECMATNEYDGRLGIRISSIFVIFIGSMLGCIGPLLLRRFSNNSALSSCFFAAKFFGSGVIIATAFIHLLAPAIAALYSPCLDPDSVITTYPWPEGICLMSVFAMFFVQLVVNHYVAKLSTPRGTEHGSAPQPAPESRAYQHSPRSEAEGDSPHPDGKDNLLNSSEEPFAVQLSSLFILEFGIIFHSVLIGLTLAVAGEELIVLYIVLAVHQTFEGVGLGARLTDIAWPHGKGFLPYVLSAIYSLSTPISIAIGLGIRETFKPNSHGALVISGVFDSISAGILLYTGLVQLVAQDFFSHARQHSGLDYKLKAFMWMTLGAGLMALLGNWA
ncbi:unnamed protein product [Clonostachys rosea]|uniref:ZIP zinc/iron transport family n=1 Tax=Bionectria ochroleuca TaxID=29856 RepID=A0ABY6UG01_BIOOC|nr:unnamed protein product [Clonostachys rosea]